MMNSKSCGLTLVILINILLYFNYRFFGIKSIGLCSSTEVRTNTQRSIFMGHEANAQKSCDMCRLADVPLPPGTCIVF